MKTDTGQGMRSRLCFTQLLPTLFVISGLVARAIGQHRKPLSISESGIL